MNSFDRWEPIGESDINGNARCPSDETPSSTSAKLVGRTTAEQVLSLKLRRLVIHMLVSSLTRV